MGLEKGTEAQKKAQHKPNTSGIFVNLSHFNQSPEEETKIQTLTVSKNLRECWVSIGPWRWGFRVDRQWRRVGESRGTKGGATISGWTSASACPGAASPRTVPSSARTTSSVYTTPKRSPLSLSLCKPKSFRFFFFLDFWIGVKKAWFFVLCTLIRYGNPNYAARSIFAFFWFGGYCNFWCFR